MNSTKPTEPPKKKKNDVLVNIEVMVKDIETDNSFEIVNPPKALFNEEMLEMIEDLRISHML